jgi:hypothetical protein
MTVRSNNLPLVAAAALALFALTSCDSSGDPPETTQFTKTIEARHANADSIVTTAELSAGGSSFGNDGVGELTREEGTSQAVTASAPKFEDESVAVPFENGNTFTIDMTLESNAPTAVATVDRDKAALDETITFTGEESSDPNRDELTYSWTFPDGDASGKSVQRSFANTGDKTAELVVSDGELEDEAEVTVTIAEPVTVEAVAFDTDEPLNSPLALEAAGETVASGVSPLTTEVSVNVDELTVSAAEHEQDKEVYADTSATFVLEDSPVTLGQRRVAHCVNGLENDGDGLVGVWTDEDGNDIPTEGDSGDPGCTSASDDGENHRVYNLTYSGAGYQDTSFVSGHPNNWEGHPATSDFPEHIALAVGNIFLSSDVEISSAQSGEGFTWRFSFGSKKNIAEIAEDDPSVDGWYSPVLLGVKPSWFSESTDGEMTALHKAFGNDNPTDGNDDVIFGYPERTGKTVISWVYEPDHPALSNQSAGQARFEADTDDDVDVTVRSAGYVDTDRR